MNILTHKKCTNGLNTSQICLNYNSALTFFALSYNIRQETKVKFHTLNMEGYCKVWGGGVGCYKGDIFLIGGRGVKPLIYGSGMNTFLNTTSKINPFNYEVASQSLLWLTPDDFVYLWRTQQK